MTKTSPIARAAVKPITSHGRKEEESLRTREDFHRMFRSRFGPRNMDRSDNSASSDEAVNENYIHVHAAPYSVLQSDPIRFLDTDFIADGADRDPNPETRNGVDRESSGPAGSRSKSSKFSPDSEAPSPRNKTQPKAVLELTNKNIDNVPEMKVSL